jgi:hypothetical protein
MHSRSFYTARTDDLVVQELGDELLIYDRRTDVAHCLSSVAALVWRTCEGGASVDELVSGIGQRDGYEDPQALVLAAVDELAEKGLLEGHPSDSSAVTRRQAIRRMAGVGAAAVAAPLIVSAAVKTPYAAAYTTCLAKYSECTGTPQCCAGLVCTRNGASSGPLYCNVATCTPKGSKPGGQACTGTNASLCCSGTCGSGANSGVCA